MMFYNHESVKKSSWYRKIWRYVKHKGTFCGKRAFGLKGPYSRDRFNCSIITILGTLEKKYKTRNLPIYFLIMIILFQRMGLFNEEKKVESIPIRI